MPRLVSQIPIVDWDNPDGWILDGNTGLPVMHQETVQQMQFGANGKYFTGIITHQDKADQPNPQMMPPYLRPEMIPIPDYRAFIYPMLPAVPQNFTGGPGVDSGTITVSWGIVQKASSYVVQCHNDLSIFVFGEYNRIPNPPYTDLILAPPFTIPNLIGNTRYTVSVASVNATGQSAFTTPISLISSS